ncbi:MAG: STAS domain-containing protein [Candidatus Riflebacteria bacterium]|nr:STAS domain-containing protein [Candidatus Riflebacteria bacterium]
MTLQINSRSAENDVTVIEISGEISFENSEIFREKINELSDQGKNRIVIDLANLKYMSSAGMGVLVHGLKITRQNNGDLKLANLDSKMRKVFLITQFTHHFGVFKNAEEAAMSFEPKKTGE